MITSIVQLPNYGPTEPLDGEFAEGPPFNILHKGQLKKIRKVEHRLLMVTML